MTRKTLGTIVIVALLVIGGLYFTGNIHADEAEFTYTTMTGVPDFITLSDHFPTVSRPVRWGNGFVQENANPYDRMAWLIAEPGVLAADHEPDCDGSDSCVWSGAATVSELVETHEAWVVCPAGGYVTASFPQATVDGLFRITEAQPMTNVFAVIRCPYDETPGDDSDRLHFTTDHPGSLHIMRYPVPASAGGFFSYDFLTENLRSGQTDGNDNCGSQGCNDTYTLFFDLNHDSVQVWDYDYSSNRDRYTYLNGNVRRPR